LTRTVTGFPDAFGNQLIGAPVATVELAAVVAQAQEIAERVPAPAAAEVDASASWPEPGVRALQEWLGCLVVPQAAGGLGLGMLAIARVGEATGRNCASVPCASACTWWRPR
jgi:alkylation response protein AidB-like acyl-CoA dehydrogenase